MSKWINRLISSTALVRLVILIMPPHRKGWAHEILNELAYIETRGTAVRWIIGSTLFAIRERVTYQLEDAFMNIRIIRTALILVAMAVSVVAGTYAIQKPYQQERIKFTLHRLLDAKQT